MNGLLGWKKYAERFNSSGRKLQGVEKPIRAAQVLRSLDSDSLLAYDEFVLAEMLELEVSYAHQLEGIYFNPKFKIELRKEQRDKNPDKLQTLIERNLGWRLGIALKLSRKDTGLLSDIHRKLTIPFDDLKQVFNGETYETDLTAGGRYHPIELERRAEYDFFIRILTSRSDVYDCWGSSFEPIGKVVVER